MYRNILGKIFSENGLGAKPLENSKVYNCDLRGIIFKFTLV